MLHEIYVENNWEHYVWKADNRILKNIKKVMIDETIIDVEQVNIYNTVYDHGHTYDVKTKDYNLLLTTNFGLKVKVSMYDLMQYDKVAIHLIKGKFK